MQRLYITRDESASYVQNNFSYKLGHTICVILLSANSNCELTDLRNIIYMTTHSQLWLVYVIQLIPSMLLDNEHRINEFPPRQWLRERATILRYTCIASLAGL